MTTTPRAGLVAAVGVLTATLLVAGNAAAQVKLGGMNVEGGIEAGGRFFVDEPSQQRKGKLEEYRDLREGLFLERLQLRIFRPDGNYSTELGGSKWGFTDQEFFLETGRLGVWQFEFDWNQIPHVYSTTARMRAVETSRGVFSLPSTRPSATSLSAAEGAAYNNARRLDEISTRWDVARMALKVTPTPDLELRAEYTRTHKDGDKPFSLAFGSPGNDFMEVLEPIDQTIHDFRLRGTYARDSWQVQFGYALSMFRNEFGSVTADNPLRATDETFGATSAGSSAPAAGRVSLPPDNMAHTLTLAGGISLPMRTRLTLNTSYSLRFQNDDFLPHTRNPNIPTTDLGLPQKSLNGVVGTTLVNAAVSTRPLTPLTLSLKYRFFDLNDMSDEIVFPALVLNDRTLESGRQAGQWSYSRHNVDADARYRIVQPVAVTLGGGWERWNRNEHWEAERTDEYYGKLATDITPFDWLLTRLTYRPSYKRVEHYNTAAHLEHTVVEDDLASALATGQSPLLRKFYEADRDRQRVDVLVQLTPTETLTTTLTGGWSYDDYLNSPLGLKEAVNWSAGIDVNWAPTERVSVFAGYTREYIFQKQMSRNRDVSSGKVGDFEDWNWISANIDTVDTVFLGTKTALIPKTLDLNVSASYAYALGEVETRNVSNPETHVVTGTTFAPTNARARKQPAFEDTLIRLETALKYSFWKNWSAKLGYVFESFQKNDFRTDQLNPFQPGSNSIWLGNDWRNYDAHIVMLTLGYQIK